MLLAIAIATAAVALGMLLGIAPGVSGRALGPLRTLALTAVIAVVALHLLPEALHELGAVGLLAFAGGLALPRWVSWFRPDSADSHRSQDLLGLELGFFGLLVHHLGDGLALGAYARLEAQGHAHRDVLFALVLHTVPLVAVVAAGYGRALGLRAAVIRCSGLALASVAGVLAARLVPATIVAGAQAWIAAAVSGLLLHGLTHDLEQDLPNDGLSRGLDLGMALAGATVGWLGARLDAHADAAPLPVFTLLSISLQRAALPLALGLVVGALLGGRSQGALHRYSRAADPSRGGTLTPEAFLMTLTHFGLGFALARDLLSLLLSPLRPAQRSDGCHGSHAAPAVEQTPSATAAREQAKTFALRLDLRVDAVVPWAVLGALTAAVIRATVPEQALRAPLLLAIPVALLFSLSIPVHAVAAAQLAFALLDRGLPAPAAFLILVLAPFAGRPSGIQSLLLPAAATLGCIAIAHFLPRSMMVLEPRLALAACVFVSLLTLRRAYERGLRGLFSPVVRATHATLTAPVTD